MSETTLLDPAAPAADLTSLIQGVRELIELVNATSVTRVALSVGAVQMEIESAPTVNGSALVTPVTSITPVTTVTPAAHPVPARPASTVIKAILIGVFYRCPAPGHAPFVEVGSRVEAGQQIAIIEAMKMMNPVVCDHAGVINEILAEDGDVVEFDQPLFTVEPG
jgi:acetyl-CoA carboxylase biotin carboxyl carrier protein